MTVLSLLNRSQNKALFLRYLKELLLSEGLNLVQISIVFMKINSVYKQASIERQSIRKKASAKANQAQNQQVLTPTNNMEQLLL